MCPVFHCIPSSLHPISSIYLFFIVVSCISQERHDETTSDTIEDKANKINLAFAKISETSNESIAKNELMFFQTFPCFFDEFISLYGSDGPLYEDGLKHLHALYGLKTISREELVERYVKLSMGGVWQADNTSVLQWQTFEMISNNIEVADNFLADMTEAEVGTVFHFILDGPHPEDNAKKTEFDELLGKFARTNPKLADVIRDERTKVIKENAH